MSALVLDAVTVTLGGATLVGPVSLDVAEGEILGLVGESGSGKSMLLAAIAGLAPDGAAVSGAVRIAGRDLGGLDERAMARVRGAEIGFVFQEPMTALNPLLTIGAQVGEGIDGDRAFRVAEALRLAGLPPEFAVRHPHQLSGGQRQRALIAMAIIRRPRILLADEPTTALDAVTQRGVISLLRSLAEERGMAMILVTHDLGLAAAVCGRVAVMQTGRVVETLRVADGLDALAHPYSRALLDAARFTPEPPAAPSAVRALSVRASADHVERDAFGRVRRRTTALREVAFDVAAGETLGLVGSSGCGKSTLARALLGLHPKGDARIAEAPPDVAGPVQIVFQDPAASLDPRLSIAAIVAEPLWNRRDLDAAAKAERVAALLRRVGLPDDVATRRPHQLSGGQRQRVAIARALVADPRLVVLDEALSALDVVVQKSMLTLLADLQNERGLAYLLITHDMNVLRGFARRVMVMADGAIIETGETARVLAAPSHPATRALVEAADAARSAL